MDYDAKEEQPLEALDSPCPWPALQTFYHTVWELFVVYLHVVAFAADFETKADVVR